jgi:spore germination cell wall hydrolase CwlJ-like protein
MKFFTLLLIIGMSATAAQAYQKEKPFEVEDYKTRVVASVIAAEAAGEGWEGMYYVANVIDNRAKKENKTPYQIVTARNQFFGYTAKNRSKLYSQVKNDANKLAVGISIIRDYTHGALYFRKYDEPRKPWHKVETLRYKNHIFYK